MSSSHLTGRAARLKRNKSRKTVTRPSGEMAEALERRVLLASVATITNGITGDNGLILTVDAYGSYGRAYINNSDPSTLASDTVYNPPGPGTPVGNLLEPERVAVERQRLIKVLHRERDTQLRHTSHGPFLATLLNPHRAWSHSADVRTCRAWSAAAVPGPVQLACPSRKARVTAANSGELKML